MGHLIFFYHKTSNTSPSFC